MTTLQALRATITHINNALKESAKQTKKETYAQIHLTAYNATHHLEEDRYNTQNDTFIHVARNIKTGAYKELYNYLCGAEDILSLMKY